MTDPLRLIDEQMARYAAKYKKVSKTLPVTWSVEFENACKDIMEALASLPVLVFLD